MNLENKSRAIEAMKGTLSNQQKDIDQLRKKNEYLLEALKDIRSMAIKGFKNDANMALEDIFNKLEYVIMED